MIVGHMKPLEEIADSIAPYRTVLVVGCDGCVTMSLTGGFREAGELAAALRLSRHYEHEPPAFHVRTILRQCERDLVGAYLAVPDRVDAVLSLACGAGVQTLAEVFTDLPVLPALNTTFLGAMDEPGVWTEKCKGCGDCVLAHTGGICPVARCAKQLFNGPCGGSSGNSCEVGEDVECAWQLIIRRLQALGRLDDYLTIHPAKDWSNDRHGRGPRRLPRRPESSEP